MRARARCRASASAASSWAAVSGEMVRCHRRPACTPQRCKGLSSGWPGSTLAAGPGRSSSMVGRWSGRGGGRRCRGGELVSTVASGRVKVRVPSAVSDRERNGPSDAGFAAPFGGGAERTRGVGPVDDTQRRLEQLRGQRVEVTVEDPTPTERARQPHPWFDLAGRGDLTRVGREERLGAEHPLAYRHPGLDQIEVRQARRHLGIVGRGHVDQPRRDQGHDHLDLRAGDLPVEPRPRQHRPTAQPVDTHRQALGVTIGEPGVGRQPPHR